jgi:hypothetical protein
MTLAILLACYGVLRSAAVTLGLLAEFVACVLIVALYVLA